MLIHISADPRAGARDGPGRKLAVDGSGRIALVESSLVPGRGSRVWLLRGERRNYGNSTYFKYVNDRE